MPPLRGCHATAQIQQRVYALVFIVRGSKLRITKKLVLLKLNKNDRIQSTGSDVGRDNISDDRGAEPVEGTCVFYFILFICSCVKSCVNSMLPPTLLDKVSISQFF